MSRLPRTSLLALATVATLLLSACGGGSDGSGGSSTTSGGTTPAATTGGPFPVTVGTAMGPVRIDKQPVRIAALDASYVDAAVALKAQVVAYTSFGGYGDNGLPAYLGADGATYSKDAVNVGDLAAPNLGKLAATRPDVIVSAKVRHEKYYNQFEKLAPTVFSETTGATWKQNLLLLGEVLGKKDTAERLITSYEQRARRIGASIKEKNGGTMPTVSVVRFAGEPTVRLYTANSYPGQVMDDVGFTRPAGRPTDAGISVAVSQERIRELDADQLFVGTYDDPTGAAQKSTGEFEANPLWKKLTGERETVPDLTWFSAVSLQGAGAMLDDIAKTFGVDPGVS